MRWREDRSMLKKTFFLFLVALVTFTLSLTAHTEESSEVVLEVSGMT